MSLKPEQKRALDYLRKKGTEAPTVALRDRARRAFEEFEAVLERVDGKIVEKRPGPDRWSVQEIVDHLVESHRPALSELGALIEGRQPSGGPIPPGKQSDLPMARPWNSLAAELKDIHRLFRKMLERANDAIGLDVKAPVAMVVKVEGKKKGELEPVEWVDELDWKAYAVAVLAHTREHTAQLERTLEALAED